MKVDEKAPARFRFIGQRLPRPDAPAKVTGHHRHLHDLVLPGMLHARVIRPPALGATLVSVDESSIAGIGGRAWCGSRASWPWWPSASGMRCARR